MRRRAAVVLAAAVATPLAAAAPAGAQGRFGPLLLETVTGRPAYLPVTAGGSVAVEWEGDPATCEAARRCALRGTTTWRLPPEGFLLLTGRGRLRGAALYLSGAGDVEREPVRARLRTGQRLCADASPGSASLRLPVRAGRVAFGLGEQGVLSATRCAGPVSADLAPALPAVDVPFARLARGRTTIRLEGDGTFAAAGLRGRVTSTVRLRIGAPQTGGLPPDEEPLRLRVASSRFRIASVTGDVPFEVTAGAEGSAACTALDACGLAGIQRIVPALSAGSAELTAYARARRPRRAVRAAIGLAPGGVARRVFAYGAGEFAGDGRVEASIGRAGEPPCTDIAPFTHGGLELTPHGRRVTATFHSGSAVPPRTRCPGPLLPQYDGIGRTELPLRAFRRRRVVLRFTRTEDFRDDAWAALARPALTLVLERTSVVDRVVRLR
jgi:hypothetical protein